MAPAILDPEPLLDGGELKRLGLTPGPQFRVLLQAVRDRQLLGELQTTGEAIEFVRSQVACG
jgi:hypothetical protein